MTSTLPRAGLAATALCLLGASTALAGIPFPTRETPAAVDRGLIDKLSPAAPMTVTVALKLQDLAGAEAMLRRVSSKTDPLYRQFLTPAQFAAKFGPSEADVQAVRTYFTRLGLTVSRESTTTLHVTGSPATLEAVFKVSLHQFAVPAHGTAPAYTYRAPMQLPTMPAAIAAQTLNVFGLDDRPLFHPNNLHASATLRPAATHAGPAATTPPDMPGNWSVVDFADYYDVQPLYKASIKGVGQTVGIVTLAAFTQSDAFKYWKSVGLKVNLSRITEVQVDGGPGAPSDESGSGETTLDVEQSGGIAPGASVVVYEAPNTNQGYLDAFAKAADADRADAISTSWGDWEFYNNLANAPVINPTGGKTVSDLAATHQVFVQNGVQGQTMFAAAGDAGAYDVNRGQAPPDFSLALTVDYPASDTAITAAGGTTVPTTLNFSNGTTITVPSERVWGWDYLLPLCQSIGYDPIECGILPVGGGGGVSVFSKVPSYQKGVAGVQKSQPYQALVDYDYVPPQTVYALPANFAGRNVPDIAMNADPESGYTLGYTSSSTGTYALYNYYGGTSFVGPQLNGVTQLLDENAGKRLGFLNPALYALAAGTGYTSSTPPLRAIPAGGNEFYSGSTGYNPAAGLGSIDVANLAAALK